VEVPGIEPGSIGGSAGLLRAYSPNEFLGSADPRDGSPDKPSHEGFPPLTRGLIVGVLPPK